MGVYVVRQGDHIASIAYRFATTPEDLLADSANAAFRERRGSGSMLHPGDTLHVPDPPPPRTASLRAGADNGFRATIPTTRLSVKLARMGEVLAGEPYRGVIEGRRVSGASDGDGKIEIEVRVTTRHVRLELPQSSEVLHLDVGALDPITEISGVQARLTHLGLYRGAIDGVLSEETREALRAFQSMMAMAETAGMDEATLSALRETHGS